MNFAPEQLTKAKAAKSVKELLAYANELNFKLTEDEAKYYFGQWHKEGELADNELSNVSGGSTCVDGSLYGDVPPHYLITTVGNTCPAYKFNPKMDLDNGTCYQCLFTEGSPAMPLYCFYRTINDDPYR